VNDPDTPPLASAAALRRIEAKSGQLDYGNAVVIHDSRAKHIRIVPFYVSRSNGSQLHVRIEYWRKKFGLPLWPLQALSLNAADCRELHRVLGDFLQIAKQDDEGDYIVLRLDGGAVDLTSADPATIAGSLVSILSKPDIAKYLTTRELSFELLQGLRTVMRYQELRTAVDELRLNLETGVTDEQTYQRWCNRHSWAFGNAYLVNDTVRSIGIGDQVDALLPSVRSGLRDIIELKRPNMPVLHWDTTHRDYFFSQDVSRAIGQCHRYLDVLQEEAVRGLRDHPEVVAYHPRAMIVIGRSHDWDDNQQKALHGLNARLNSISVMTYDHLLAQGENALQLLAPSPPEDDNEEISFVSDVLEYDSDEPPLFLILQEPDEEEDAEDVSEEEAVSFYREMYDAQTECPF
jgi:Shedu protein SduA, C-terminal